jgi:hypothetical protein
VRRHPLHPARPPPGAALRSCGGEILDFRR